MNKTTKTIFSCLVAIIVIIGCKYAGNCEYQEVVISSISQELYQKVKHDLGGTASEKEICDAYINSKLKYDSLGI